MMFANLLLLCHLGAVFTLIWKVNNLSIDVATLETHFSDSMVALTEKVQRLDAFDRELPCQDRPPLI